MAQYSLQVRAVDNAPIGAKLSGEALVEITILDENDNRPHFSRRTYDVQVSEDIDTADRPVIAEIHATDADEGLNSRVRYSITGGNNDGLFAIDDTNGQLSLLAPIDYETHFRGFKLNVRARDSGSPPASNSTQVNITVIAEIRDFRGALVASSRMKSTVTPRPDRTTSTKDCRCSA